MSNLAWPALLAPLCGGLGLLWTTTLVAEEEEDRPAQTSQYLGAAGLLVVSGVCSLLMVGETIQMLIGGWQLDESLRRELRCFPRCSRRRYREGLALRVAENWPLMLLLFYGVLLGFVLRPLPHLLQRGLSTHG